MPDRPVPIVNALVAVAVTVVEPPKLTELPLMVTVELVNDALPILLNVLVAPEIEVPANVVNVPPNATEVLPIVIALLVNALLGKLPMAVLVTLDITPLALTANTGTVTCVP